MAKTAAKTPKVQSTLSISQQMASLAELVEQLEDPEIELETALKLYEEGVKLSGAIQHTLEVAEQRVAQVAEDGSLPDEEHAEGED